MRGEFARMALLDGGGGWEGSNIDDIINEWSYKYTP